MKTLLLGIAGIASILAIFVAPAADFNITNYGAKSNEAVLETTAIQSAIDAACKAGGGRVIVPAGRFQSGSLNLKDNVTLRLDTPDSVLAGSDNQNMTVTDCQINTSCNGMRFGAKNLTVKRCRFWGPGQFMHRISHNTNMWSAFTYFSPLDRRPMVPGDNIIIEDCTVANMVMLFSYDYGYQWEDGQVLKGITLRNITASGLDYGVVATGDAGKHLHLTMENVEIGFKPGRETNGCVNISNVGTCVLKGVTVSQASK